MLPVRHNSNKRGVHFAASIDWEAEGRRSWQGSESRRQKRERKKLAKNQLDIQRAAVLEILRNVDYDNDIVSVCQSSRFVLHLVVSVIDYNAEFDSASQVSSEVRRLLNKFRGNNQFSTVASLNSEELNGLDALLGNSVFSAKFSDYIPSTVVSSTDTTPENTPDRQGARAAREQARRDTEQGLENDKAELLRNT